MHPKCLHIGKYYPPFAGGMENFTKDLLDQLAKQGARPVMFAHNHKPNFRLLKEPGGSVPVYLTPSYGRFLYAPVSPFFLWHLGQVIQETKPEILHIHLPNLSAFWLLISRDCRQIPWVVHWHADVITDRQPWYFKLAYRGYRRLERALLKTSRQIIVTSEPYLKTSRALESFREKCSVIPLGIGNREYHQSPDRQGNALKILSIGRLTYYKGFHTLIRAAEGMDNIEITIIGVGEERESLEKLIEDTDTGEIVELAGYVPNDKLQKLIQGCDVICLPSIERTEAFGVVLLEAMRAGKAVIASDVNGSGIGWVVENRVTGLLITPESIQSLRKSITQLRDNPALVSQMGLSGRQRYEDNFTIDKTARQVLDIYNTCL